MEQLRGEFPDGLLDQAIEALQQGETDQADSLFQQIENEGEGHIKRVAEAAFQRGKIAQDAIRYTDALEHYENAVRLQPYNTLHLNEAGLLHHTLANYKKAIAYFELVLATLEKFLGKDHPNTRTVQTNLDAAQTALSQSQRD
ncbi:tetratricopeptide repeat protein [Nitrosomonas aestuarii]|uniref:tetratricopeptide repeat protein n=1 Tax=Nitrosomonas aestuarii TaxID=52441 RepID=UPI000D3227EF|nr:tetratricopeptide repeat protein [Nitrosomonas aestuarii]PTN12049.1 tetratricopeptide repeat protein [Nitrosomonas aestuarii]